MRQNPIRCMAALLCLFISLGALADDRPVPTAWTMAPASDSARLPTVSVPGIDPAVARENEKDSLLPGNPLKIAAPRVAKLDLLDRAQQIQLDDGRTLARLRVEADGATDLSLHFSRFQLPPGATVYLYDEQRSVFQGPWTADQNPENGQFWSPVVPGGRAIIEITWTNEAPQLSLQSVFAGYRDMFGRHGGPYLEKNSGSCNIDVVCDEGDDWRNEIRSVARIIIGGTGACTGTLLNDANQTFTPWFLTADHCQISESSAASVVFYWNYESPTCGTRSGGSLTQNQSGSQLIASRQDVDMALLRINQPPPENFNVFYSGWSRSNAAPQGAVAIHHPSGDLKAISFADEELEVMGSCILNPADRTPGSHWWVPRWNQGTTEPGSSGSAIWDPDNNRVVGFLSGGQAACSNPNGGDCYGRFDIAWDGPSADSRLSDHLDPDGITASAGIAGAHPGDAPPDDQPELGALITGTWFDPNRDGEGCQLSREADAETFVITCYTYLDGRQVFLVGVSQLVENVLQFNDVVITSGGQFGNAFDPTDINEEVWGSIRMRIEDCNNATLTLSPEAGAFSAFTWNHTRVIGDSCEQPSAVAANTGSGTYFDPARSGEGLQLVRQPGTNTYVASLYTYLNGEQAWVLGFGERNGNRIVIDDAIITEGTGFGNDFDGIEITESNWGTIQVDFDNCNDIAVSLRPTLAEFENFDLDMTRILRFDQCP